MVLGSFAGDEPVVLDNLASNRRSHQKKKLISFQLVFRLMSHASLTSSAALIMFPATTLSEEPLRSPAQGR